LEAVWTTLSALSNLSPMPLLLMGLVNMTTEEAGQSDSFTRNRRWVTADTPPTKCEGVFFGSAMPPGGGVEKEISEKNS